MDNIPDHISKVIDKTQSCQFCQFISPIIKEKENLFSIKARIFPPKSKIFGERGRYYEVKFLIHKDFPYKKVKTIPLSPELKWYPHQLGDWTTEKNTIDHNTICPPEFNKVSFPNSLIPYIEYAYKWITDALENNLISEKEHYELPHIISISEKKILIYIENGKSIYNWIEKGNKFGIAFSKEMEPVSNKGRIEFENKYVVKGFQSGSSEDQFFSKINCEVFGKEKNKTLIPWAFVGNPKIEKPHKPPKYWDDFSKEAKKSIIHALTNNKIESSILLLAFSVPENWGEIPKKIYWRAIDLSKINLDNFKEPKIGGFRKDVPEKWPKVQKFKRKNHQLNWLPSCIDISRFALNARKFSSKTGKLDIALLGVGALGSVIAKGISKTNYNKLVLIDKEIIEPGNLVRHEATPSEIGKNKAYSMKEMLSPTILRDKMIKAVPANIIEHWDDIEKNLESKDLIIDATADFAVHQKLSKSSILRGKNIVYCYIKPGPDFGVLFTKKPDSNITFTQAEEYLENNLEEDILKLFREESKEKLVWPEPGCYDPTFRASYHRVRMMGDSFLDVILSWIKSEKRNNMITLFQQTEKEFGIESKIKKQLKGFEKECIN